MKVLFERGWTRQGGTMMVTGWKLIGSKWYYFEPVQGQSQGRMYRNESTPDSYRLGPDGSWVP